MRGGVLLAGFPAICTVSALAASDAPPEGSDRRIRNSSEPSRTESAAILTSMVLSAVSSSLHVSVPLVAVKSAARRAAIGRVEVDTHGARRTAGAAHVYEGDIVLLGADVTRQAQDAGMTTIAVDEEPRDDETRRLGALVGQHRV